MSADIANLVAFGLLAFAGVVMLCAAYMLIRNKWIYKNRVRLLWSDYAAYQAAPSYEWMWGARFWDWNFDRLCKSRKEPTQ